MLPESSGGGGGGSCGGSDGRRIFARCPSCSCCCFRNDTTSSTRFQLGDRALQHHQRRVVARDAARRRRVARSSSPHGLVGNRRRRLKLGRGQRRRARRGELGHAPRQRGLSDVHDRHDVPLAPLVAVDVRRDEEGGAADPGGPPPGLHPVALHRRHQPQRRRRHGGHRARAQPQPVREPVQIQTGVDGPGQRGMVLQAQQPAELQEDGPQDVDVDLQGVGEVDQHEGLPLLAADDVEARGRDLRRATAPGEVLGERQTVQAVRRVGGAVSGADPQTVHQVSDLCPSSSQRLFMRIELVAVEATTGDASQTAGGGDVGDVVPVDGGLPPGPLGEGGVGREGDVVEHAAAGGAAGEAGGVVGVGVDVGAAAGAPDLVLVLVGWFFFFGGGRGRELLGGVRKKKKKEKEEARGGGGGGRRAADEGMRMKEKDDHFDANGFYWNLYLFLLRVTPAGKIRACWCSLAWCREGGEGGGGRAERRCQSRRLEKQMPSSSREMASLAFRFLS